MEVPPEEHIESTGRVNLLALGPYRKVILFDDLVNIGRQMYACTRVLQQAGVIVIGRVAIGSTNRNEY